MKEKTIYRPRIVDAILEEQLEASGMVLIQGAKWCGKTTTAKQQAKSILYMNNPKTKATNLHLAETAIDLLLEGAAPRLLDECQGRLSSPRVVMMAMSPMKGWGFDLMCLNFR